MAYPKEQGKHPDTVLILGTGEQDRDSKWLHHKPFEVIADCFSRRGFAVLRLDDRDVGGTSRTSKREIADLTEDVLRAVEYLRANEHINPDRIILVGHSQGGLTEVDAAAKNYYKALSLPNAYGISMGTVVIPQKNHFLKTSCLKKLSNCIFQAYHFLNTDTRYYT